MGKFGKFGFVIGCWDMRRGWVRFCWECGVAGGRYEHLRGVRREGVMYYPCGRCRVARVGEERCGWAVCTVEGEGEGEKGGVEGLPRGVLERVCAELGYEDLLRLKRTSRRLWEAVDPVGMCRDVFSMGAYLMEWMSALGEDTDDLWWRPMACYGCFRLKNGRHFSPEQLNIHSGSLRGDFTRRRCWECLRRFYHPQLADVAARERFNRQALCGVCKCLRFKDEDCKGCVVHKDEIEWARLRELKNARKGAIKLFWDEEDEYVLRLDEDTATMVVVYDSEPDILFTIFDEDPPVLVDDELESDLLPVDGVDEDRISDSEPSLTDVDDAGEGSSTAHSSPITVADVSWEQAPKEDEALSLAPGPALGEGVDSQGLAVLAH
jgi:hypothetical protein